MERYTPLIVGVTSGLLRWALGPLFVWLLERSIIHEGQQEEIIGALATLALAIGWIVYSEVVKLRTVNTAAAMGLGVPPAVVRESVKQGLYAPALSRPRYSTAIEDHRHGSDKGGAAGAAAIVLGLVLFGLMLAGCGKRVVDIPPVPPTVVGVEDDIRGAALYGLGVLHAAGNLVNRASAIEASFPDYPGRPVVRAAFRRVATTALAIIAGIENGTLRAWPAIRAAVDPLLSEIRQLQDDVAAAGSVTARLREWLASIWDLVTSLSGTEEPAFLGGQS